MIVRTTTVYARWLKSLRDDQALARILRRTRLLEEGHLEDVKYLREGVSELRIHYGPGYRIYLARRGAEIVILLAGGDKRSQQQDIAQAIALAKNTEDLP